LPKGVGDDAIEQVASLLSGLTSVIELTKIDLECYGNLFKTGWSIPFLFEDESIHLRLLIPESFPFAPPRIGIWPKRDILSWPHLEECGLLCLLSNNQGVSPERPGDVVVYLLVEAIKLVKENLKEIDITSFRDEFISYWAKWAKGGHRIVSLMPPDSVSKVVLAIDYKNFTIVSNESDLLCNWCEAVFKRKFESKSIYKMPYIWLEQFPIPSEYPTTVSKLNTIIKQSEAVGSVLDEFMVRQTIVRPVKILFGSSDSNGSAFGGLNISHVKKFDRSSQVGQWKGRRKAIPIHSKITTQIEGIRVVRCDPEWIHGRDQNMHIRDLQTRRVLILGVGSLGSGVAQLLSKSGVGQITLIDPDFIASENVGRHELGIQALWDENGASLYKATALANQLTAQFPHAKIFGVSKNWQNLKIEDLFGADLVVSTIGEWSAEAQLNNLISKYPDPPPIVFGWTEPHAVAGHGVLIMPHEGCLRCIVNEMGIPKTPVAEIPIENVLRPIPACGGHFQPYGAVELSYIQSLVAELCLSVLIGDIETSQIYSWIGSETLLKSVSANWNQDWIQLNGDPGGGSKIQKSAFIRDPHCFCCGS